MELSNLNDYHNLKKQFELALRENIGDKFDTCSTKGSKGKRIGCYVSNDCTRKGVFCYLISRVKSNRHLINNFVNCPDLPHFHISTNEEWVSNLGIIPHYCRKKGWHNSTSCAAYWCISQNTTPNEIQLIVKNLANIHRLVKDKSLV